MDHREQTHTDLGSALHSFITAQSGGSVVAPGLNNVFVQGDIHFYINIQSNNRDEEQPQTSTQEENVDQEEAFRAEINFFSPLRLVLVGVTGAGKSAVGNVILGREEFKSNIGCVSVTQKSEGREGEVCGRRVLVVDTPGLCHTELSEGKLREEMLRAMSLCDPGPHVFLLVIQLGRFTDLNRREIGTLQELFSKRVNQHTMVVFTHGDKLENKTIEEFIDYFPALQQLLQECGNRYHVFNDMDMWNTDQVKGLLRKINMFLESKSPVYYMND